MSNITENNSEPITENNSEPLPNGNDRDDLIPCEICNRSIPFDNYNEHITRCRFKNSSYGNY